MVLEAKEKGRTVQNTQTPMVITYYSVKFPAEFYTYLLCHLKYFLY